MAEKAKDNEGENTDPMTRADALMLQSELKELQRLIQVLIKVAAVG